MQDNEPLFDTPIGYKTHFSHTRFRISSPNQNPSNDIPIRTPVERPENMLLQRDVIRQLTI